MAYHLPADLLSRRETMLVYCINMLGSAFVTSHGVCCQIGLYEILEKLDSLFCCIFIDLLYNGVRFSSISDEYALTSA